jgi:hypothetical protein
MATVQEEFSFGAKASKAVWGTLGAAILLITGWVVGGSASGSRAIQEPPSQPMATIGAVTSAAESRAQGVALAESAKLRTDVQTDLARHRGDLTEALNRMAAIQTQQAATLSDVRSAVARIEGRLDAKVKR